MGTIYGKLFPKEEIKIIFQGLDAAGKTTALYRMKLGEVVTTIPTIGFNVETVDYKNINITVWDVGGRDKIRPLYRYYYPNTKALVFVVDSSDREEYRIEQARDELHRTMAEDELGDIPLLVLANKQDLANAMSVVQITEELQLHKLGARNWYIIPTVATTGDGLYDALDWLTDACKCKTKKDTEQSKAAEPKDKDSKSKETENSNELTKPTTTSYMNKAFDTLKRIFFAQG